jgi:methylmalonyl-CoA mutase N-terminal domain/subunit
MHLAPRTQQIVAYESGIADTADPWPAPTSWRA